MTPDKTGGRGPGSRSRPKRDRSGSDGSGPEETNERDPAGKGGRSVKNKGGQDPDSKSARTFSNKDEQGHGRKSEPDLPARVTSVKPQKKKANRFSLYHGKEFIIGVSTDTLVKLNLKKGMNITHALFERIAIEEEQNSIKQYLLRLLGRRDHSKQELKTKATAKGFAPGRIDPVLEKLEDQGYLDDGAFARKYVHEKLELQKWGPVKIRVELAKKGIGNEQTDRILAKLADDSKLKQICVELVIKRMQTFSRVSDEYKRRKKIATFLQRRGFTYSTINRALPEIMSSLDV